MHHGVNSYPFRFKSNKPSKPEMRLFQNLNLYVKKSMTRSSVRLKFKVLQWVKLPITLQANQQFGYRTYRSTLDHLVRLGTFISDAFIQNQHSVTIVFGLQMAKDGI